MARNRARHGAPKPLTAPHRYAALDGWRGVCACLVVLYHWRGQLGYEVNSHIGQFGVVRNAYLFVDFFFVLSGFVIAATYQERLVARTIRFVDFVILRFGRLWPLHVATLLLTVAVVRGFILQPYDWIVFSSPPEDVSLRSFAVNVLMLQGMHVSSMMTWNHPSWSISAEFFTYLAFAGVWIVLKRRANIAAAAFAVALPYALFRLKGQMNVTYDWSFLRALLGFSLGVLAHGAMRTAWAQRVVSRLSARVATVAELAAVAVAGGFVAVAGERAVSIAAPYVFAGVVALFSAERGAVSRALRMRFAQLLGRWSYSIYLVQFPVQQFLMYLFLYFPSVNLVDRYHVWLIPDAGSGLRPRLGYTAWFGDATNVVMMLAVLGVAGMTYTLVETPGRNLARKIVAKRRGQQAPAA